MEWHVPPGGAMSLPIGSSMWKVVCMHPDKRNPPDADGKYPICPGTNKKI